MFVPALDAKRIFLADMNRDASLDRDIAQEYLDEIQRILRETWTEFKHWIAILKDRWYHFRVRVEDWWERAWKPSGGQLIITYAVIQVCVLLITFAWRVYLYPPF
jgi:broad specificity phosphatase PhoE